jgi:hypothetical protein
MSYKKKKGRLVPVQKFVYNTKIGKSYKTTVYINPDKLKPKYKTKKDISEIYKEMGKLVNENVDFGLTMKVSACGL